MPSPITTARWISCTDAGSPPFVTAFRRRFTLRHPGAVRIHVSADERYELFVDGRRVGRGPERGDRLNWFYETRELALDKGPHVIVARVWALGNMAAFAQHSTVPGFILAAEGEFRDILSTGVCDWQARRLEGYAFTNPGVAWGTGANLIVDGARFSWDVHLGGGPGWKPVGLGESGVERLQGVDGLPAHLMRPATLPPMLERAVTGATVRWVGPLGRKDNLPVRADHNRPTDQTAWNDMLRAGPPVVIPARTRRRVIIDLNDYYCAYPRLRVSGGRGASVTLLWAESLFTGPPGEWPPPKGNRDQIDGKFFNGVGDSFHCDGRRQRQFETLWWQAGRYVEVSIVTAAQPLTVEGLEFHETRYPLDMESGFDCSDARLTGVVPIMLRALRMCSHEIYMDCPYYEQLMYVGDTRLEVLTTYALTHDDRLPRKALAMFDASRQPDGLTQSRYPSRVTQIIPPFSLWWVAMVHDFAMWRDDAALVRSLMPGVRGVMEAICTSLTSDGLLGAAPGWNYMDWVATWDAGVPPQGKFGISGPVNWQLVLIWRMVQDLEAYVGEPELVQRADRFGSALAARAAAMFWDENRGLLADDLDKQHFSEHTQCVALLGGRLDAQRTARVAEGLLRGGDLAPTTIYFTHYLFETYRLLGRVDRLLERMALWFELEKLGLKTTLECPEPSRSDCHAWGAHPLYHYLATILGIRPGAFGFSSVSIEPRLGTLSHAAGRMVHPRGMIEVDFHADAGRLNGAVTLPDGLGGTLVHGGQRLTLYSGRQEIGL